MESSKIKPKAIGSPLLWVKLGFWFTLGSFLATMSLTALKYLVVVFVAYFLN